MKVYKGSCASPGLVLGQVSRLEHHVEITTVGPFKPSRELQLLTDAIRTAQDELESMADRAAPSEQAIFQFQSMMLDDEGMMNEVRFCINAGIGAAAAMNQVGQRYADQLANMKDNPYMQLRSVDILDASRRVINIITNRPRMWLALDHPVILAAERLMPTDLFSVPSGMILGIITAEGSGQSHAAIIARAMNIPGIVQVGRDFLDDCDGRTVILDATGGQCTLDPDAAARQQAETRICELQRENEEMGQLHALPNRTKNGQPFELLANCFGPEDIDTAMQSGAQGVGLLRTGYMMLPGRILDEQEQYFFYCSCLAAAQGRQVTVRTFDFGSDRTISDAYQGLQSSKQGCAPPGDEVRCTGACTNKMYHNVTPLPKRWQNNRPVPAAAQGKDPGRPARPADRSCTQVRFFSAYLPAAGYPIRPAIACRLSSIPWCRAFPARGLSSRRAQW